MHCGFTEHLVSLNFKYCCWWCTIGGFVCLTLSADQICGPCLLAQVMAMRVYVSRASMHYQAANTVFSSSFDFIVKGFTIGCSVTGETPFSTLNVLPVASLLPSQQSTFVSLACICLAYVTYRVQRSYRYAGVSYDVPVPEQCGKDWEGEVLENPSIKVSSSGGLSTIFLQLCSQRMTT